MTIVIAILLFLVSFIFRAYGFFHNYPFWVDEFSTAIQSQYVLKYGLSVFNNPDVYFEHHNILTHFITAGLFHFFGASEWVARFPSLIFGSLIPVLVFFLARHLFNSRTGLFAALLTTFSYFQISWSRQARSYVLLQLIILVTTYLYFKILDKTSYKRINLLLFIIFAFIGFITHSFFYIFLLGLGLHLLIIKRSNLIYIFKNRWAYLILILFLLIAKQIGLFSTFLIYLKNGGFVTNNLWYYHSFLWRDYSLLTFLTIIGLIITFIRKKQVFSLFVIYFTLHFAFLFFGFKPMNTRYILPIFPFMLMLVGYSLNNIPNLFFKNQKHILVAFVSLLLTLFIILNGDKFVNRPKKYYSLNHDFREIALINYKQIYGLIKDKGINLSDKETAIIDTWTARTYWYIDLDYQPIYALKWKGNQTYVINNEGEKIIPRSNNQRLIENANDLKKVVNKYHKGFILIDDTSLPKDVIEYSKNNFKQELYLDHYSLDDNPYSIWPVTLYSWGIE